MAKIIFYKNKILNNIKHIKSLLINYKNIKFNFPLKCCRNKMILELFLKDGFGFDVSNINEYEIIKDFKDVRLGVSGPLSKDVAMFVDKDSVIYFDDLESYLNSTIDSNNKGLRINFNSNARFMFSHFGVDVSKINIKILKELKHIHFHIVDIKGEREVNYIVNNIKKIISNCESLISLNIGGGLDVLCENVFLKYITNIRSIINSNCSLIIECGDLWFQNTGYLYTNIYEIKNINNLTKIIYLPICYECHLKWSRPILCDMIEDCEKRFSYMFYGVSCYEKDIINVTHIKHQIEKTDILKFKGISHYSVEWNNSFNGIDKIEVQYE